ncbi:hypothetical protein AMECASPLE_008806 [Ameca splendens]|uniref:Secreted protein n=1 Tax=Ameca splendens TaxID=208324 RepID=A0ABV0XD51_9TELE
MCVCVCVLHVKTGKGHAHPLLSLGHLQDRILHVFSFLVTTAKETSFAEIISKCDPNQGQFSFRNKLIRIFGVPARPN